MVLLLLLCELPLLRLVPAFISPHRNFRRRGGSQSERFWVCDQLIGMLVSFSSQKTWLTTSANVATTEAGSKLSLGSPFGQNKVTLPLATHMIMFVYILELELELGVTQPSNRLSV